MSQAGQAVDLFSTVWGAQTGLQLVCQALGVVACAVLSLLLVLGVAVSWCLGGTSMEAAPAAMFSML